MVDRPLAVSVEMVEAGPVRGRLRVTRHYRWPERLVAGSRDGEREVDVVTDLEVRAGEDRWCGSRRRSTTRAGTTGCGPGCRCPPPATVSRAECAFAIVERGLAAEGGPHESGLATFPSRRFVSAGGLTVLHEGLLEYELVDGGRALALTLLRATGMLSRDHMAYRPNPAGPALPVEGPQMLGRQLLRYCLHLGDGDPYALADQAWVPLEVVAGRAPAIGLTTAAC